MAWKEAIKFKKQVEADDKHLEAQWKKILETIEVQAQNGFRSVTQSVLSAKEVFPNFLYDIHRVQSALYFVSSFH